MSSTKAPYATLHDLPKFEKRSDVVSAPWLKDDIAPFNCGRGASPDCYIPSNSQTAPFATFHNQPHHHEGKFTINVRIVGCDYLLLNKHIE
ncbi:unnamed protein product [Sphagnum jensenii]|uniref:Uncharacterized protein n=1 Tax=Sphagnum jensenii TaxID=128206 RepID=A0ABP1BL06_9BRYO